MATTERAVAVEGMSFAVRTWRSLGADGWFWAVAAEDHDWTAAGTRARASERLAVEAACAHLARVIA